MRVEDEFYDTNILYRFRVYSPLPTKLGFVVKGLIINKNKNDFFIHRFRCLFGFDFVFIKIVLIIHMYIDILQILFTSTNYCYYYNYLY